MKRIEIFDQIEKELSQTSISQSEIDLRIVSSTLTDLFIQLSEERCQEQKILCEKEYDDNIGDAFLLKISNKILNAPFPTLD